MAALRKAGGGASTPRPPKVTSHQLTKAAEVEAAAAAAAAAVAARKARREVGADEYAAAVESHDAAAHRASGDDGVDARSLDAAVAALTLADAASGAGADEDRRPERRARAAYTTFADRELARLKSEKPGLKLSQYKELLWRAWQKSPDNPMVVAGRV